MHTDVRTGKDGTQLSCVAVTLPPTASVRLCLCYMNNLALTQGHALPESASSPSEMGSLTDASSWGQRRWTVHEVPVCHAGRGFSRAPQCDFALSFLCMCLSPVRVWAPDFTLLSASRDSDQGLHCSCAVLDYFSVLTDWIIQSLKIRKSLSPLPGS